MTGRRGPTVDIAMTRTEHAQAAAARAVLGTYRGKNPWMHAVARNLRNPDWYPTLAQTQTVARIQRQERARRKPVPRRRSTRGEADYQRRLALHDQEHHRQ